MMVSVMMVRVLVDTLEHRGASRKRFFELAGLDESALDNGSLRLELGAYLRALDAALTVSNDPALGLHIGERATPVMFDVLGHLAEHASSLRQSIHTAARYARLVAEGHDPQLLEVGDTAWVRFPSLRGNLPAVRLTAEFALVALSGVLRRFAGPQARASKVCFAYQAPEYSAEYRRVFGDIVQFGCEVTELEFPRAWLESAHTYSSPDLHALLETRAEHLLGRLERDAALTERVISLLASHDPREMPTMEEVARELQMSGRSLRRKLAAEGASYAELVERTLMNVAKRMLQDPRASIQQTAYAMGFAAPAAFHRAFKRWTGLTPKQYQSSF
ncbi:MAG TPA: AraC family transcriptional regulator [Polyangiales bacterium]|nr:AraC family transcriptional regulator [Polyangiales bacterium]